MIATLSGIVSEKLAEIVVLEAGGVGYGVLVTSEDHSSLKTNESARLYIYEHIRENTHDLFGFLRLETKDLFELLLGVNGVGPKMAINLLSIGSSQDVRLAIAEGNVKFLQAASGVGRRVAERVVVDLKDKVGLGSVDLTTTGMMQAESRLIQDEAVQGLIALGYTAQDAARALQDISAELPVEERIRSALQGKK